MAMGRQQQLKGMERQSIPEIDAAAEAYFKARDERMKLTEEEVETRDALLEVMRRHKLNVYRDDEADPPLIVTRKAGEDTVKVTVAPRPGEEADGETDEGDGESDEDAAKALS